MYTPDTLSRLMANDTVCKDIDQFNEDTETFICSILDSLPVSHVKLQKIIEAQDTDKSVELSESIVLRADQINILSLVPYVPIGRNVQI